MIEIKGPYNSREIEKIYNDLMISDFYDDSYNAENWSPEPYDYMADIIEYVLQMSPRAKMLDIGCGRGYLTSALVRRGYDAIGTEFSPRMFEAISAVNREHFRLISSLDDIDLSVFDIITSLEVFEHLPLSLIVSNLTKIRSAFAGLLLLTIPSSGQDRSLPGLGFDEDGERLVSMANNVVCPYLVYEDGHVSGGHITLAGYRWWEDFFLTQGFCRQLQNERRLENFLPQLVTANMRWCFYILRPLKLNEVTYGRGWYGQEEDENGMFRWNGSNAELYFISNYRHFYIILDLVIPSPNISIDANLRYFVQQLSIVDDYRMNASVIASGWLDLNGEGQHRRVSIPVTSVAAPAQLGENYPAQDGAVKSYTAYKLHLQTPLFVPSRYLGGGDQRELGFRFSQIEVASFGGRSSGPEITATV